MWSSLCIQLCLFVMFCRLRIKDRRRSPSHWNTSWSPGFREVHFAYRQGPIQLVRLLLPRMKFFFSFSNFGILTGSGETLSLSLSLKATHPGRQNEQFACRTAEAGIATPVVTVKFVVQVLLNFVKNIFYLFIFFFTLFFFIIFLFLFFL